jgi:hypothetical protein
MKHEGVRYLWHSVLKKCACSISLVISLTAIVLGGLVVLGGLDGSIEFLALFKKVHTIT